MSTYDTDSPGMKNFWWNLHVLADAAVMVSDQEQRAKKGKFKAVSEEEEEEDQRITLFDHVPRKIRTWVRHQQQHYENPNGASTSSTLPHLLCKMPQRKISRSKLKKAKVVVPLPRAARETSEWLVQVMRNMNESQDSMLIFERSLSTSDVNSGQSRLLIPFNMMTRNDFLTHAESLAVGGEDGVKTILVNKWSEKWDMRFKRWPMKKKSGNGTLHYALNRGWNAFVKDNGLKANDEISLWSFRCLGFLCFALEHRPKSSI